MMKNLLTLAILLINGFIFSQEKQKIYPRKYLPENIKDAINYMDYLWKDEDKENFKRKPEKSATLQLHFGFGMAIRNSWINHGNPKLPKYFHKRKVFSSDDMSSIILIAFHRKLNNKELRLDSIFKSYRIKWREGKPIRKMYRDSLMREFNSYKIKDTIVFKYYSTVIGNSPEDTEKYGNCKSKAILLKKRKKDTHFFIKLISSCDGKGIAVGVYDENFSTNFIATNKTGWTSYWDWEPN